MSKQTVFIVGATGETGSSIVDALLDNGNFVIIAGVRPASASKPEVAALKSRGVEIRLLDLENSTVDQIAEILAGVDTVISTIFAFQLHLQKPLADAAKKAGVKRFIPCDWATACVRGVWKLYDDKLIIHDYIQDIGLKYTFIDIGWWMQNLLPYINPSKARNPLIHEFTKYIFSTGDVKCAITDPHDIGKFVARIIADPRTLNQYVFCQTEEVTQNEAFAIAEKVSGKTFSPVTLSVEEVTQQKNEASDVMTGIITGYNYSLWIRGDNTVENAKKAEYGGALDARELYPELTKELKSFEDFAKEFYANQV